MVTYISKHSIFIYLHQFHHRSFLHKVEVFTFCPGVLQRVAENIPFLQKLLILLIQLDRDRCFLGGILAVIQEEIVVFVFLIDSLLEKIIDFL